MQERERLDSKFDDYPQIDQLVRIIRAFELETAAVILDPDFNRRHIEALTPKRGSDRSRSRTQPNQTNLNSSTPSGIWATASSRRMSRRLVCVEHENSDHGYVSSPAERASLSPSETLMHQNVSVIDNSNFESFPSETILQLDTLDLLQLASKQLSADMQESSDAHNSSKLCFFSQENDSLKFPPYRNEAGSSELDGKVGLVIQKHL